MVIETFKPGAMAAVYKRYSVKGRMLPDGLVYIDSWVSDDGGRCFQLMEAENVRLFDVWAERWKDLVDFEVIPVQDSPTKGS
ncbi:MAG: DUF3303 family protein [Pseudomonadota bacterium]